MCSTKQIPKEKVDFIEENKDKMTQAEIAKELDISVSCVNQYIKGKRGKLVKMDGYFKVDAFLRKYPF